jgi:hypothetical protein
MEELRHKVNLPVFRLSKVTDKDDPGGTKRTIRLKGEPEFTYFFRFCSDEAETHGYDFNLFPVVLDKTSAPWSLGTLFILSRLEGESAPEIATAHLLAEDLGAFKQWLDTHERPDELVFDFPEKTLRRVTYRFFGFLKLKFQAQEIASNTANRRMGTVCAFYRWLIERKYFVPDHPLWEEKTYQVSYKASDGRVLSKTVVRTDLSIKASSKNRNDEYDGIIQDGGRLRPLTEKEQDWVLEAAEAKGNTECLLIQLFMLDTGARIESASTLRERHFIAPAPIYSKSLFGPGEVIRLQAGPGTGIETKDNKEGTFQISRDLYELLHIYANSDRAKRRRQRYSEVHGEHPDPYLFLTQQGNPYFIAKTEAKQFDPNLKRRHIKNGQTIRQFIKEHAIPYIHERYEKQFQYRPHDLRASFGMNVTEELMSQVQAGKITLYEAFNTVRELMWHESLSTTEQYLNYKKKMHMYHAAINGYGERLQHWVDRTMKGLDVS